MATGSKFTVDKIYIDGKEFKLLDEADLEFTAEDLADQRKNTPLITIPTKQEATFTCTMKIPLRWKLKWEWMEFKRKLRVKRLTRLLKKCGATIEEKK